MKHLKLIGYAFLSVLLICALTQKSYADKLRPAYLQLSETKPDHIDVVWRVPAIGNEQRLALTPTFDDSAKRISGIIDSKLGNTSTRQWQLKRQGGLSGLTLAFPSLQTIDTEVLIRLEYANGHSLTERLTPERVRLTISNTPSYWATVSTYFVLGVEHIWFGIDHLLFVFVLVLLVKNRRQLVITITSFTIAHSITLIAASIGWLTVPIPPVEAIIALSIVFVAREILLSQQGKTSLTQRNPWLVAFSFGLLHGLGFAAALGEIGLPQNAIFSALLIFNVGVEFGQLSFVVVILLLNHYLKQVKVGQAILNFNKIPPYVIGGLASFWVVERVASFWG